ncbi:MAG TPA: 4-hydroxy-tetrahydrodipicolinate synthase [Flavobacteriales bacterium]|nr:4-hydroxy-tetrahydrodipicolinate synthase [Flavobacteriales bacterium]|tara:strand:- start:40 stop:921 length:882 start_codon:yes stop_codon:yes gene_type:complete
MLRKISGTGVALVTPFKSDLSIDFEALTSLVNHCVDGNIDFLVVMGTTGESVTLSLEEKNAALDCVKQANNNRLPIVLGIGGNNTDYIIQSFSSYNLDGVDAILSVSPAYNKPTQEGIYQHFKAISKISPLPIILYNVPGRTSSNMTAETTLRLAHDFDNIIAVKEASGDMQQIMEIISKKPIDFKVLSGDDAITLPIILMGGNGVISVLGQALPKDFSSMVKYGLEGDLKASKELHYKILSFVEPLFVEGNPAGIKTLLNLKGICKEEVRLPLVKSSAKLKSIFEQKLNKLV